MLTLTPFSPHCTHPPSSGWQAPARVMYAQDGRGRQIYDGGGVRENADAIVLSSALLIAERDPAAAHCTIHVQQAQVSGPGGWHAQYIALVALAAGEFELNQRIETGEVDPEEAVRLLKAKGHRACTYSTVKKAVSESLKGKWNTGAAAELQRSADRKRTKGEAPVRDKRKLCPELTYQRDAVNGSHKKCGLCGCLERLCAEATTAVARHDIKLLQRVHADQLKRDRLAERLGWTCPLYDKSVIHVCMDGASKSLAGIPCSHKKRNSQKYNGDVLGHQMFWTIIVADVVTNGKTATVIFLTAPWLAKGANTILEVRHRLRLWMAANGCLSPPPTTITRQSDGGSDMWNNAMVEWAAMEIAHPDCSLMQVICLRLQQGHSHNPTDGSIQLVARALEGTRNQASGIYVLTRFCLQGVLMGVAIPGRQVDVLTVLNAHDWSPTHKDVTKSTIGIMSVHKLTLNRTDKPGEVAVTTHKHMGDDLLAVQPVLGEDGCHLQSAVIKNADPTDGPGAAPMPTLPTTFATHDLAGIQSARDAYALVEQILNNPQQYGLSPPRSHRGTLQAYVDIVRAQVEAEKSCIPRDENSPALEPGVAEVVDRMWPAATGPPVAPRAHQAGLADDLVPTGRNTDELHSIGTRHDELDDSQCDHEHPNGRGCFVLYTPAESDGEPSADSDGEGNADSPIAKVWVVTVGKVDDNTAAGPEDQVLRQYDWHHPPSNNVGRCKRMHQDRGSVWFSQPELTIVKANVPIYATQIQSVMARKAKGINLTVQAMATFHRLQQMHGEREGEGDAAGRLVLPDARRGPQDPPTGYRARDQAITLPDSSSDDDGSEIEIMATHAGPMVPSIKVADVVLGPTKSVKNIGQGFCWYLATAPVDAAGTLVELLAHLGQLALAAVAWQGPPTDNLSTAEAANATQHLRKILAVQSKLAALVATYIVGCADPAFRGGGLDQGSVADVETAADWGSSRADQYRAALCVDHACWGGEPLERLVPLALQNSQPGARLVMIEVNARNLVRFVRIVTADKSRSVGNPTAVTMADLCGRCGGVVRPAHDTVVTMLAGSNHYERVVPAAGAEAAPPAAN